MTATAEPSAMPTNWADALAAYQAAEAALEAGAHLARITPGDDRYEAAEAEHDALVDRVYDAMHALMAIPAPDRDALALKLILIERRGNAGLPNEAQWQAIKADTIRMLNPEILCSGVAMSDGGSAETGQR